MEMRYWELICSKILYVKMQYKKMPYCKMLYWKSSRVCIAVLLVLALLFTTFPPAHIRTVIAADNRPYDGSTLLAENTNPTSIVQDYSPEAVRLVVQTIDGTDLRALASASGGELVRVGPLDYSTLQFEANKDKSMVKNAKTDKVVSKEEILTEVLNLPGVLNAEWSVSYTTSQLTLSDPEYELQWGLNRIRADQVWAEGITGEGIIIAVVDTGVDLEHPDLTDVNGIKSNLVQGYNAYTGSALPGAEQDDNGHGTSVAGVIAALNNNLGIVGIAYNAKIMPIKAMDKDGEGEDSILADGIIWAADHGAKIINMSIGSAEQTKVLDDALLYAARKGCLLIAASGNIKDYSDQSTNRVSNGTAQTTANEAEAVQGVAYPAAHPSVMAVSAVDRSDTITDFSLIGPEVILSAPGERILTSYWSETEVGCGYSTGTSIAAPFVTGAAALLWSKYPELSPDQIKHALLSSAYDLGMKGRDNDYGFGRVDVYRALKLLQEQKNYPSPAVLGWEGGTVYAGSASDNPPASLSIPAGSFSLVVDDKGTESKMTVHLEKTDSPGDFPSGIDPAGDSFQVNWGEAIPHKVLTLELRLDDQEGIAEEQKLNRIAYLYKWSNSRWIRVGGGVSPTASENSTVQATIYEPGIYRAGWSPEPDYNRLSGQDRIATAIEIAGQAFPTGTDNVIIARADTFPDALAGAPLAYKLHAPILLTYPDKLPSEVNLAIREFAPRNIYILGGIGAVSAKVEEELLAIGNVRRIAGENRYETAASIAGELGTSGVAVIVNGTNFPDAIAAASQASVQGLPILLTSADNIPDNTEKALRRHSVTASQVIGGSGVVSESVMDALEKPFRISGADRYGTSAAVLRANPPAGRIVFLATGLNFPDALTGGVLAALNSTDIILLPKQGPNDIQRKVLATLNNRKIIALGGEAAVTTQNLETIKKLVNKFR